MRAEHRLSLLKNTNTYTTHTALTRLRLASIGFDDHKGGTLTLFKFSVKVIYTDTKAPICRWQNKGDKIRQRLSDHLKLQALLQLVRFLGLLSFLAGSESF